MRSGIAIVFSHFIFLLYALITFDSTHRYSFSIRLVAFRCRTASSYFVFDSPRRFATFNSPSHSDPPPHGRVSVIMYLIRLIDLLDSSSIL